PASWPALLRGGVGDRVGRQPVTWFSILGALPFALLTLTWVWTGILAVLIAMIMASPSRPSSSMHKSSYGAGWVWQRECSTASPSVWGSGCRCPLEAG